MSGEEQPQPFASDEEMYHVWRGAAPAVCQRRGDVSCLERSSPSRLPATRRRSRNLRGRIIMSGEEQPQPFASDEEMISESSRTQYHVWRGTAPAVCQRRGDELGVFAGTRRSQAYLAHNHRGARAYF
ncbi:uncharacterized protein LOC101861250 isoform X4 [Aplysia californica]|uniref:Uncharacterized protein LOC101861250 isoform X4 n=1 Tax=Aplysia californica TaxID=6500 RepID=A0ABM1W389_APLCA|nr:uncharacterized protein LOC101861250 isoform X4 [Aplysia californica]XP_035829133.1 uncharacterized protein LOC101861250 isoform X4 [Aplysia californica]